MVCNPLIDSLLLIGVPRILENTLPDYLAEGPEDWALFGKYMETSRLNINIRQVNPSNDQE
jgi:alkylated DNA repair protein alkB family protein 1